MTRINLAPLSVAARVTSLPTSPVDGQECYLVVDAANNVIWHMRYSTATAHWEYVGGGPIYYRMDGANVGYAVMGNGSNVCSVGSTFLQWVFTPPVPVWCEVHFNCGLVGKTDAAYHYAYLSQTCAPGPAIGNTPTASPYQTQHTSVQQYMGYLSTYRYGLSAGVQYTLGAYFNTSGGTWQYYQAPNVLWMTGRAWPR